MTPAELKRKITAKIADLDTARLIFPAAQETHRRMIDRLFEKGQGADGKLGAYSTEGAYFTKKQFKNKGAFKAKGKTGKTKFEDGTPHTSMFLDQGYKELKEIQGYEGAFVNLQYSKDLRNDFSTGLSIRDDKVVAVVKRKGNSEKIEWLTAKYGAKTFKLTTEERQFYRKEVSKALTAYFNT